MSGLSLGRAINLMKIQQNVKAATSVIRPFSVSGNTKKYVLPSLPYSYSALEPAISGQIMETHHSKHHQAYVNNLNNALQQLSTLQSNGDLTGEIGLQNSIRFNGGGHLNHSIFWTNLAPKKDGGGAPPTGDLLNLINSQYGSFDKLKDLLTSTCMSIQGSGWGWLGYNKSTGRLEVLSKANQDPLTEYVPLLGIDVWEHAYYYLYGPARAEYLKNLWSVVNWQNVNERFTNARK